MCTLLAQRLFNRQAELLSEGIAWLMLPFLIRTGKAGNIDEIPRPSTHDKSSSSFQGTWFFAAGIAISSFCTAENGVAGLYVSMPPGHTVHTAAKTFLASSNSVAAISSESVPI